VKLHHEHSWSLSFREAVELQKKLSKFIITISRLKKIRRIAGADIAVDMTTGIGYGGIILFAYPSLDEIERVHASGKLSFPYIPGLLSFREIPLLLKAYAMLSVAPDLIFCDGHGIAHPRRFGFASHFGLLLDKPSVGCAKSRLIGAFDNPEPIAGSHSPLMHNGETVGAVLRTRTRVKPVFVSIGHRIDLPTAIEMTMACTDGYRIPRPTRLADHYVNELKRR
jgi:deoxyribonuclease V